MKIGSQMKNPHTLEMKNQRDMESVETGEKKSEGLFGAQGRERRDVLELQEYGSLVILPFEKPESTLKSYSCWLSKAPPTLKNREQKLLGFLGYQTRKNGSCFLRAGALDRKALPNPLLISVLATKRTLRDQGFNHLDIVSTAGYFKPPKFA
ncbi:hypothetical protein PIB30_041511 [Stylosanthes scabra]|uniref:Uncharacterized protein n=1 Tax=Stylosanthes scabra TaxID=79078 RepID=A0ABU6VH31_9FABA|nr:hypothetical protein [Stylosanthes scabra]